MVAENKRRSGSTTQMVINKGKLYINNQPYKAKISVPMVQEINGLTDADLNRMQQLQIMQSSTVTEKGRSFTAYAVDVCNIN